MRTLTRTAVTALLAGAALAAAPALAHAEPASDSSYTATIEGAWYRVDTGWIIWPVFWPVNDGSEGRITETVPAGSTVTISKGGTCTIRDRDNRIIETDSSWLGKAHCEVPE